MASSELEALTQALARLPGLGPRSARRAVLHLIKKRESVLEPLLKALAEVSDTLSTCSICRQSCADSIEHFGWDKKVESLLELVAENIAED